LRGWNRRKKMKREYRTIQPFQPTTEKRIDTEFYIEGIAATFEPYELYENDGNKYYEKVERSAFDEADLSDVIMQYDHSGKVLARKSNGTLGVETTDKGLTVFADLSKSKAAKEMYEEIANGLVTKMSWAFTVGEDDYNRETRTRTIKKVRKLYDVSAVGIPANGDTEISARSYFDGVIEIEKREALARQKQKIKILLESEV
jgi:hypothetical protein